MSRNSNPVADAERQALEAEKKLERSRELLTVPKDQTLDGIVSLADEMTRIRAFVGDLK
jgi:hypothetical protein